MLTVMPRMKAKTMHGKTEEKTMMWVDYAIDQAGPNFTVKGDWPGEVMGWAEDGTDKKKDNVLYRPGDVFVVNESGWLIKQNVNDKES